MNVEDDIYEPLARYRDEFREKFSRQVSEAFEELLQRSGVDEMANAVIIRQYEQVTKQLNKQKSRASLLSFLIGIDIISLIGLVIWALSKINFDNFDCSGLSEMPWWAFLWFALGIILLIYPLFPMLARLKRAIQELEKQRQEAEETGWKQMEPLNRLYEWDMVIPMITQTVPRLEFDPFFSVKRLEELHGLFGFNPEMDSNHSITYAQSGEINGNPFVFGQMNVMRMGEKTYTGSITIHWTTTERDSKGRRHTVHHTQVLTASVTKPCPMYSVEKFLTYGNEAAPNLTFSRQPSDLSGGGNGFWDKHKRKRKIKKLRKFSQNLEDESQYTMMDNEEFEALFETMNRDNEIEYRLLFTPLAQQQILLLLNDDKVGYGDDFAFLKQKKINTITAAHLDRIALDTDPARFRDFNLARARQHFQQVNEEYFKALYFSLAPLLAIPLYQQHRPETKIYHGGAPCVWEYEAIANYHDVRDFAPASCVTPCILKTFTQNSGDEVEKVAVTAYGFRTEKRTDYVTKLGGDGHFHEVPVHWDEYLPVNMISALNVTRREEGELAFRNSREEKTAEWDEFFRKARGQAASARFRRSLLSFLPEH